MRCRPPASTSQMQHVCWPADIALFLFNLYKYIKGMFAPLAPLSLPRDNMPLKAIDSMKTLPSMKLSSAKMSSLAPLRTPALDTSKDQRDVSSMSCKAPLSLPPKKTLHLASLNSCFFDEEDHKEEEEEGDRSSAPSRLQRQGLDLDQPVAALPVKRAVSMPVAKRLVPIPPASPKVLSSPSPRTSRLRFLE